MAAIELSAQIREILEEHPEMESFTIWTPDATYDHEITEIEIDQNNRSILLK